MTISLERKLAELSPARREKIEARARDLIAEEMTLRDLRKARDLTQTRMAETLGIGQDGVSRLEKRSDLLLSTLRSYVAAMGGSLDLVARFPDRPPVIVSGLVDFGEDGGEAERDQPKPGAPGHGANKSEL